MSIRVFCYWVYGPKYENGDWKSQTNRELEEMSKGANIVKWIKGQRISWLGLYGEVNSVTKHNYKIWLNDGVY